MGEIGYLAAQRRRVVAWLWLGAALLTLAHLVMQWLMYAHGHDHIFGLLRLFDLDDEANVPTWYATTLLLCSAVILASIAARSAGQTPRLTHYWWVLAAGFLAMSVDEAAMVHDLFDAPTTRLLDDNTHPALLYAWVVPYTVLVLALGVYFLRFLSQLPAGIRWRFIVAGAVYVTGALGIEFLEGMAALDSGEGGIPYAILNTVQEVMEFAGVILFIDALLLHVSRLPRTETDDAIPAASGH